MRFIPLLLLIKFMIYMQFDRNVVTHFQNQEQIFDYIFAHLGVNNEENFSHPLLLTEAIGNPNYFRQRKLVIIIIYC